MYMSVIYVYIELHIDLCKGYSYAMDAILLNMHAFLPKKRSISGRKRE